MNAKRSVLAALLATGLMLPALGGIGASSAEAAINRMGGDAAPSEPPPTKTWLPSNF